MIPKNNGGYVSIADAYNVLTDYYHHKTDLQHAALLEALLKVPPAEVRPVVLCRDCVHFTAYSAINADGTGKCGLCGKLPLGFIVDEYDFCSSGERCKGGTDG